MNATIKLLIIPALTLSWSPFVCRADDADKKRIEELERKMAELEREKAEINRKITRKDTAAGGDILMDSSGRINPRISNAVLVIEGDRSVGTGFVVSTGDKKFVYTAAHVFSGNTKLTIRNASGTGFKKFGPLQAAEGADLVRLEVLEEVADFLEIMPSDTLLRINARIAALGNGGGNGVVAVEKGVILGTSGDSLEVDAGIIQGNSGGPVVELETGKAVGLVTHLTRGRTDVWSEGTRQGDVRRFACRLDKDWKWKTMPIATFLADAKAVDEFETMTRICSAMTALQPSASGLRIEAGPDGNTAALEILQENQDNPLVKSLMTMNADLASRRTSLSDAELKKKFRSLLSQIESQARISGEAFKPQKFAWFHRKRAEGSLQAREESLAGLRQGLDRLR